MLDEGARPALRILRAAARPLLPWRNGLGTTTEVARGDLDPPGAEFAWRISIARLEADAPFSAYPGVDRVLALLSRDGVDLLLDGAWRELRPFEPVAFPGEAEARARLRAGPTLDLNVMTRRGTATATLAFEAVAEALTVEPPRPGEVVVVLVASGGARITGGAVELGLHDAAELGPEPVRFEAAGPGLVLAEVRIVRAG